MPESDAPCQRTSPEVGMSKQEYVEQCGFSAAGRPDDGDDLARHELKADLAYDGDAAAPVVIGH